MIAVIVITTLGLLCAAGRIAQAGEMGQLTGSAVPTATRGPRGFFITVNADQEKINVRAGPGADYARLGELLPNHSAPALGRSLGGDWIQIAYPSAPNGVGWVYAYLVTVSGGELPIVEPPPSPTPRVTPTIDLTLAAQFVVEIPPTRLPTFTPPPPLLIPTFRAVTPEGQDSRAPMIYLIAGMGSLGLLGLLLSWLALLLRRR